MKRVLRDCCPPILWRQLSRWRTHLERRRRAKRIHSTVSGHDPGQDLEVYWDPNMTKLLETWGEGTVWTEIQSIMAFCEGRILDIACGTGKTTELILRHRRFLDSFLTALGQQTPGDLDIYGIDISDQLIGKAIERGLSREKLVVGDAAKTEFADGFFDYAFSIGSLEHFTEDGLERMVAECDRIVRRAAFHQVPVSRSGEDEGWTRRYQSFHNNSVEWWTARFRAAFPTVHVLDSSWEDDISFGKWFFCQKSGLSGPVQPAAGIGGDFESDP